MNRSSVASLNQVELPIDIVRYSIEDPKNEVKETQPASIAYTESAGGK